LFDITHDGIRKKKSENEGNKKKNCRHKDGKFNAKALS